MISLLEARDDPFPPTLMIIPLITPRIGGGVACLLCVWLGVPAALCVAGTSSHAEVGGREHDEENVR